MTTPKPKILYVDDEPVNLSNFEILLRKEYNVLTADTAEEGLQIFQQESDIEVVITDQKMPDVTGAEFLAEIIRINPAPVRIMLSAYTDPANMLAAINVGRIFQFLNKPMDSNEVKLVLSQAVTKFRLVQENKRLQKALEDEKKQLAVKVEERTRDLNNAYQELAKVACLKDEFLANMSHELRTPLTAILGMTEALTDLTFGSLNDRQLKSLNTIGTSGTHLLELLNDILDVARIESGKVELLLDTVAVDSLCEVSVRLVNQTAQEKGVQISVKIDPDCVTLGADMLRLKQILVNLLGNAIKFSESGSEVVLAVTGDSEQGKICFSVRDQGIGIDSKKMDRLFEPFEQLDAGLSREYGGTGLGLALVRRLTELHGGAVSVESTLGVGSCFSIILPWEIRDDVAEDLKGDWEVPAHCKKKEGRILLAEDNRAVINTISPYLENCGYDVDAVRNGVEAVESFFIKRPDIILMDIQMPIMNGLTAIQKIRELEDVALEDNTGNGSSGKIPIIALTALVMPSDLEKYQNVGADGYLSKPVNLRELLAEIDLRLSKIENNTLRK